MLPPKPLKDERPKDKTLWWLLGGAALFALVAAAYATSTSAPVAKREIIDLRPQVRARSARTGLGEARATPARRTA
jgi:hypothetical protein